MAVKEREAAAPPTGKISFEEFLEWATEDTWAEWVKGEVVMVSPASDRHQDLVGFLGAVLRLLVEARQLGVIRSAPFTIHLANIPSAREPDLMFIRREHTDRLQENFLEGPADAVIEITSPSTIHIDRGEKYVEYEASGVSEYWLIDPLRQQAEFHRLGADGRYHPALPDAAGIYHSQAIPDFWLHLDWLWQDPLPQAEAVAIQIGGAAHIRALAQIIVQTLGPEELRHLLDEMDGLTRTS